MSDANQYVANLEARVTELEAVLKGLLNDEDGLFATAEFNTGPTWSALNKHGRAIEDALKPVENPRASDQGFEV